MRQNIIKKISLVLMLAVIFSGCKKWIDTDINIDPNNPADVTLPLLLPATQASLAYTYGGDMTRYEGIWMQHISGVERQMLGSDKYQVLESDINNLWNTLYGGSLINLKVMMEKAEELDAKHYLGVAKALTAVNMLNISSVWGDVPYSDALQGREGNTKAKYDTQQEVYAAVNTILDEAIALFGQDNPSGVVKPGADDLFYKGDIAKWTKLAKSLKVRAALHLSKKNGLGPVRDAINGGGLLEAGDDFMFAFGSASSEWNPRYQFDSDRGDIRVGKRIVDLMVATGDPRMVGYFAPNGDGLFVGSGPGEGNTAASFIGPAYASQASPVYLMNAYEVKFIEAEAFFGSDNGRAAAAYNDGVKASLAFHGVSDAAWEAIHAAETSGTITLEKIMTGKYIAMFMNLETWGDWRRTGIPSLGLPTEAALTETPRRYLYPLDETLYNTDNVPAGQTATSRVWWDSN
jgi:hypothetical protein